MEKGKVPPEQMFRPPHVPEGTYGSYNEEGLPLTDGEGKPLSRNASKKLQKELDARKNLHQEYLAWQKTVTP